MKKLIFLISFCLLSQNYTIANEEGEARFCQAPVPLEEYGGNVLRQQNAFSSSIIAKPDDYQSSPKPALNLPNSSQNKNTSPKVPLANGFHPEKSVVEENVPVQTPVEPISPEFPQEKPAKEINLIQNADESSSEAEIKQHLQKNRETTSTQPADEPYSADNQSQQQKEEKTSIQAVEIEQSKKVETAKEEIEQKTTPIQAFEAEKPEQAPEIPDEKAILRQFAPNPVVLPKKEIIPTKFTPTNVEKQLSAMEEAERAKKLAEEKAKQEAEDRKLAEERAKQEAEAQKAAKLKAEKEAAEQKAKEEADKLEKIEKSEKVEAAKEEVEQKTTPIQAFEAEKPEQAPEIPDEKAILRQFAPNPVVSPKKEIIPTKFTPMNVEKQLSAMEEAERVKKLAEERAKQEAEAKKLAEEKAKQEAEDQKAAKLKAEKEAAEQKAREEAERAKKAAEERAKQAAEAQKAAETAEINAKKQAAEEKPASLKEINLKKTAPVQEPKNELTQSESSKKYEQEVKKVSEKESLPEKTSESPLKTNVEPAFEPQTESVAPEPEPVLTPEMILRQYAPKPVIKEKSAQKFMPAQVSKLFSSLKSKNEPEKQERETFKATIEQPVKIKLTRIEFPESKVFTQEELQALAAPLLGNPVTIEDIKKITADITRCYTLGNYPTSKAYLPPQEIKDGVLKIGLMEGKIGKVNVQGNRWTKTSYFKKRIANKEGEILNIEDLEKDVIRFNNNNSAKVSVSLAAGENTGETDVTLNAIDPFPYRISFMTDNMGRKSIGTGRFGTMLSADGLFRYSDRFAVGGYLGRGNRIGFADYSIPVGNYGTRLGVTAAASNISVVNGMMRQFDVGGTSQVYTAYLTHPIFDSESANIKTYTGVNFRKSTSDIMDLKFYDKNTFSITQGFTAKKDTARGIWYTGHYGTVGIKSFNDDNDFFKYEGNITRLHDFGKGIIGQFRVSGQYSPNDDLPWMEQFQIGGMSTVRGYSEALLLGKSGYFASAELITPIPLLPKRIGSDRLGYIYPRDMIKGAIFMDNGMIFPFKGGESIDSGELLMSWGFGLRVNLKDDLAARFYWGYGLHNRYETDYKMGRFHFDITCAPDVGKLVSERKPSKNNKQKRKKKSKESESL